MIRSAVLQGISAIAVDIEIAIGNAPGFQIVGLGRLSVREGRERLRNAILASGYEWPTDSITINLAPGDVPKEGTSLDLAMALAILSRSGQIRCGVEGDLFAIGELGLEGTLRSCRGALSMARVIPDNGKLLAPFGNRYELGLRHQIEGASKDFAPMVVNRTTKQFVELPDRQER